MKQTFLYAVCGVILITAFSGCAGINALLKSGQPDLIYSKALEYYQKEKWSRASTLFEGVQHYYSGTPREDRHFVLQRPLQIQEPRLRHGGDASRRFPPQVRPQRLHRGRRRHVRTLLLLSFARPFARPDGTSRQTATSRRSTPITRSWPNFPNRTTSRSSTGWPRTPKTF